MWGECGLRSCRGLASENLRRLLRASVESAAVPPGEGSVRATENEEESHARRAVQRERREFGASGGARRPERRRGPNAMKPVQKQTLRTILEERLFYFSVIQVILACPAPFFCPILSKTLPKRSFPFVSGI